MQNCCSRSISFAYVRLPNRGRLWLPRELILRSTRNAPLWKALVICEVTLSLVLLSGAAGLMQRFLSLMNQDLGFNPHNLIATRMDLPNATPAVSLWW